MQDFGEYIPFDATFYDTNVSASTYHNYYVERWAQIVHDLCVELGVEQDIVPFHRSSALKVKQINPKKTTILKSWH